MLDSFVSKQLIVQNYSIRVSSRAKYMRLTMSLTDGVTVVIPKNMTKKQINRLVPEFVKEKQQWIHSTIAKLHAQKQTLPVFEKCPLPDKIVLNALDETFIVLYSEQPGQPIRLRSKANFRLEVSGDLNNKKIIFTRLEAFFKLYAYRYLESWLDEISSRYSLPYNRLTVRSQKTRWGSCSAKKNINLNYRLLFLDKNLVEYILLHELIHTLHMNHSSAFWSAIELLMPDARIRDKEINQIGKHLPCWLFFK